MINNELLSFIKERLSQGETKEQVTEMLVANGGWDHKDAEEAFDAIEIGGRSLPSVLNALEKEVEEEKTQQTESPVVSETPVSAIPAIDAEKIQFADPASAPILTTTNISPTPVSFATLPVIPPITTNPSFEVPLSTPSSMEIPKIETQDVSEITLVSDLPTAVATEVIIPEVATPPVAPVITSIAPSPLGEEIKIDQTLQSLRTRFMQGKVSPPSVSPDPSLVVGTPQTTPFVPSIKGLSPHTQSGMIPAEKPIGVSFTPAIQTAKLVQHGVQPISVLPKVQKLGIVSNQRPSSNQTSPTKSPGRKLLGFFMLMTGMVLGAIAMHAYLNGYMNFLTEWITTLI